MNEKEIYQIVEEVLKDPDKYEKKAVLCDLRNAKKRKQRIKDGKIISCTWLFDPHDKNQLWIYILPPFAMALHAGDWVMGKRLLREEGVSEEELQQSMSVMVEIDDGSFKAEKSSFLMGNLTRGMIDSQDGSISYCMDMLTLLREKCRSAYLQFLGVFEIAFFINHLTLNACSAADKKKCLSVLKDRCREGDITASAILDWMLMNSALSREEEKCDEIHRILRIIFGKEILFDWSLLSGMGFAGRNDVWIILRCSDGVFHRKSEGYFQNALDFLETGDEELMLEALKKDAITCQECDEAIKYLRENGQRTLIPPFILKKNGEWPGREIVS